MVMGHVGLFGHFIHAFHMPMFFFVSGFLYKSRDIRFSVYTAKKAKSLLLPYGVFVVFHYLINSILYGFSLIPLKNILLFPTKGLPIAGALWFLVALFISNILYYWIDKIPNNRIQCIIVIVISVFGQVLPKFIGDNIPFAISAACVGVGLMYLGMICRRYEKCIVILKIYEILFYGALVSVMIMKTEYVNMREGVYPQSLVLFWINALGASIVMLNIAKMIKEKLKDNIICKILQNIGKNSIVYVCLNQIVVLIYDRIINAIGIKLNMWMCFIELFFVMITLFCISYIFEHTNLKVLFGRF